MSRHEDKEQHPNYTGGVVDWRTRLVHWIASWVGMRVQYKGYSLGKGAPIRGTGELPWVVIRDSGYQSYEHGNEFSLDPVEPAPIPPTNLSSGWKRAGDLEYTEHYLHAKMETVIRVRVYDNGIPLEGKALTIRREPGLLTTCVVLAVEPIATSEIKGA